MLHLRRIAQVHLVFFRDIEIQLEAFELVEHLPAFREVRDSYLAPANRPASTTIGIAALARAGALLEIEAVAVLPAAARSKSARGSSAKRAGAARKRRTATKASRSRRK